MSELVQASGQGTSSVPQEKYKNIQIKIKELHENDLPEKFEKRAGLFEIYGMIIPSFILVIYIILCAVLNLQLSLVVIALSIISVMFIGLPLAADNMNQKKEAEEKIDNDLENYRKQLLNAFFDGNVVGEVGDLNEDDWKRIKVRENNKTETYMVRIKTDDKQLEHIESMEVVETDQ